MNDDLSKTQMPVLLDRFWTMDHATGPIRCGNQTQMAKKNMGTPHYNWKQENTEGRRTNERVVIGTNACNISRNPTRVELFLENAAIFLV